MSRKPPKGKSLAEVNPELVKQWHPTKNGELTPNDVTPGSNKKVWWKCPKGDDHEWKAIIASRNAGRGCGICRGLIVVKSNSLAHLNPLLSKEWHHSMNGELTPKHVTMGSKIKVWWQCDKGEDHIWKATVYGRNRGRGCAICRGLKVVKSNSLAILKPELAKEWHPKLNGVLTPDNVTIRSHKKVWWKCSKGSDHEWQADVGSRVMGNGCAVCSNRRIVKSNCLATLNPSLAKEWHPKLNGNLTPDNVAIRSHKKVWWKCSKVEDHVWKVSLNSRTKGEGSGCPYCTLTPQSKQELIITFELLKFFPDINPKGLKTKIKSKLHSIDIYIPSLDIGIEFDGNYWHKGKRELDKVKTLRLLDAGFNIIRIREEPLKRIFDTDIISKKPYNGKEITDNLLKQIMTTYKLDKRTITKIEKYLLKDELQNEKALDKYIDQILTEKAEKKSKDEI